jgi:PEP-CTERM motif
MLKLKLVAAALAMLCLTLLAGPVRADGTDSYTYTAGGNTFTWQLSSNPVPSAVLPTAYFTISNLSFTDDGVSEVGTLDVWNSSDGGGFDLTANGTTVFLADTFGPQIYKGSESDPTMLTGLFLFADYQGSSNPGTGPFVLGFLKVTPENGGGGGTKVPEPSSLLLLGAGLMAGLVVTLLRKN